VTLQVLNITGYEHEGENERAGEKRGECERQCVAEKWLLSWQ
jgi:hypothetical protein